MRANGTGETSESRRDGVDVSILLPDLRVGGAERVTVNLANALVKRGLAVEILVLRRRGELLELLDDAVRVTALDVDRMRDVLIPLAAYLRRTHPRSLLACMWPLTSLAVAAKLVASPRTRLVVAEHGTWSGAERHDDRLHRTLLTASMHLTFPRAQAVVAVSEGAADDLARVARLPRARVTAVYNPIVGGTPWKLEEPERLDPRWAEGPHKKVLAVGTLKAIKDYPTLLRAVAIARRSVDLKLLVLGEGSEREALERLVAELGLEAHVFLHGLVRDTSPYYRAADLHVLSSLSEGLPTVIVEALAHGVPVVSTDCPCGPREILGDGRFGRLTPVGDAEALASAIIDSLLEPRDRTRLVARAADFEVERATDAYLALLLPT